MILYLVIINYLQMDQKKIPENQFVEIFLSATLVDHSILSKPSTYCILKYTLQGEDEMILGQTEIVKSTLNPVWEKNFQVDYQFELLQQIKFEIYESDNKLLGICATTVGNLVGAKNNLAQLEFFLPNKLGGTLKVVTNKSVDPDTFVSWSVEANDLKNVAGVFGTSSPYLKFMKLTQGGFYVQVYKTETKQKTLNPVFDAFEISSMQLSNGLMEQPFKVECWDEDTMIGEFKASLFEIFTSNVKSFELISEKGKPSGKIRFLNCKKLYRPTFIDYIRAGEQINVIMGINYTLQNGDPQFPDSLHRLSSDPNHYEDLLLKYDYDSKIAVYGFGGAPHLSEQVNSNETQQCFPLTGDYSKPEVLGYENLNNLYRKSLQRITLGNPGLICPLIQYSKEVAKQNGQSNIYTVLVILTCGKLKDIDEAEKLIATCNRDPLQILLIGIGEFDFEVLEKLNENQKNLQQVAAFEPARDLVKFANYSKFSFSPVLLQREMFRGLPYQFVLYKNLNGLMPGQQQIQHF